MKHRSIFWFKASLHFLFVTISFINITQGQTVDLVSQFQLKDFQLQSSAVIGENGIELSNPDFQLSGKWYNVQVPSTVLTGLVANKVYPDPYQGLNNMLIPDASDNMNQKYDLLKYSHLPDRSNPWKKPYWYISSFDIPSTSRDKHLSLILKGINYRAGIWINGKKLADSSQIAGMFGEYELDISSLVRFGRKNAIAIKIYPLDFPGEPDTEQLKAMGPFYLNGGPTGDIGKNVTMLCSVGWDWMPPVRDRNMGIWQPVYIRTTGKVTINHPKIVTDIALPDTSKAMLSLQLQLHNYQKRTSNGDLVINIQPDNFKGDANIAVSQKVSVPGNKDLLVNLSYKDIKEFIFQNPRLWWPNGYGAPNLYKIYISYIENGKTQDINSFSFGIRTVNSMAHAERGTTRRDFYVNGKRIHLTGGAWVPDMMLNRDSLRNFQEMELCRNSNMNLVRIWGGGVTPEDPFWDAADRNGLLIWSDFWITGDTQGEFKGSADWPFDAKIFTYDVISTIYRVRNHPSLLVWTGGNEGHARKELYDAMRNNVIELDGTRPFIPSSSGYAHLPSDWKASWPDNQPGGVFSGGPYAWKDAKDYFYLADTARDWVFKDETGIPSQPPLSTLNKIIPDTVWDRKLPFPLNDSWGYHDAATGAGRYDLYYKEMENRYGPAKDRADFSLKMQLLNWIGYQGIFEAAGHRINDNGGVLLWKLNAALPSVIWQIYDWYLQPNAGYYAMQNVCEPIHIQMNPLDSSLEVVNRSYQTYEKLSADITVFNKDGQIIGNQNIANVSVDTVSSKSFGSLKGVITKTPQLAYIILRLRNQKHVIVSKNVYWLAPKNDFRTMQNLPTTTIQAKESSFLKIGGKAYRTYTITNNGSVPAFFLNLRLVANGEELHNALWDANYISLLPGESQNVKVSYPLGEQKVTAECDGWNLPLVKIKARGFE